MIDYENLQNLARQLPASVAVLTFAEGGDAAIKVVYRACKQLFTAIDPSQLGGPVLVFSQVEPRSMAYRPSGRTIVDMSEVQPHVRTGFALEVDSSTNAMWLWPVRPPAGIDELRASGVVFLHDNGNEQFLIADTEFPIPRVFAGEQSIFSIPNYANLADALAHYRHPVVRHSECAILETIWYDDNRLFLIEKPEDTIQRSLQRYLHHTLRHDAEVMREQNVDDTHPVDIRVTFHFTNRVALIEVKWLGKSKHPDGSQATQYTASRAVDGAEQLAGYLDGFAQSSPSSVVKGYLLVLDARRRGLTDGATTISAQDGMHYADLEIDFQPRYEIERPDFSQPLRMFAEPICS